MMAIFLVGVLFFAFIMIHSWRIERKLIQDKKRKKELIENITETKELEKIEIIQMGEITAEYKLPLKEN
jgi:hypothetical protein